MRVEARNERVAAEQKLAAARERIAGEVHLAQLREDEELRMKLGHAMTAAGSYRLEAEELRSDVAALGRKAAALEADREHNARLCEEMRSARERLEAFVREIASMARPADHPYQALESVVFRAREALGEG
jgi:hypothetical protein